MKGQSQRGEDRHTLLAPEFSRNCGSHTRFDFEHLAGEMLIKFKTMGPENMRSIFWKFLNFYVAFYLVFRADFRRKCYSKLAT